jgi:hypothetical protein
MDKAKRAEITKKERKQLTWFILGSISLAIFMFVLFFSMGSEPLPENMTASSLSEQVIVDTAKSVNDATDVFPYRLKVKLKFPEGSLLAPNDILNESFYTDGYALQRKILGHGPRIVSVVEGSLVEGLYPLYTGKSQFSNPMEAELLFSTRKDMEEVDTYLNDPKTWILAKSYYKRLADERVKQRDTINKDALELNK